MSMLLKIWRRHKFEPYRGYIAEHPNDEEEVEGIDLHQRRYPWEGSDMDYLYDEQSSFAQHWKLMVLYFMFQMLTQAPMLILSFKMPKSQCSGCCKASGDVTLGAWFIGLGYTKSVVTLKLLPHLTLILVLGRIADCE
ncbi:hypothetical protein YC2023_077848 [Brassica napus]